MLRPIRILGVGVFLMGLLVQACASNETTGGGSSVVEGTQDEFGSAGREAAVSAISRAEVFEAQRYAPGELQQAYDLLSEGDAEKSEDLWAQSKEKADEASSIAAPLAGEKWIAQLEEDEQKLKDLRGDLYMSEYYSALIAMVDQAREAAAAKDWDQLLSVYQKTAQPLSQVVAALDSNLRWLNQLKQETEGILGEADRKNAQEYVLPILSTAQEHYNQALDSLDANDLQAVEHHLFMSRHYARETLRILDIAVNLKDVDGQIERQGSRVSRTLQALKEGGSLEGWEQLSQWSSQGYLEENPLVEISLEPREYVAETSQLQQPDVDMAQLSLAPVHIRVDYQRQPVLITQQFADQQPAGGEDNMGQGLELLDNSRSAWEKAVNARNEGDLERARYYLQESSRYLNTYTSQYSILTLYTVKEGDCLWRIAAQAGVYNDAYKWPYIYLRNRDLISNPNLIYPGQKFIVPVIDFDIPNIQQIIQDASDLYENSKKERQTAG